MTHLKLFSKLRGVGLRIHTQHVLIGKRKLTNRDGGLSTQTGLKYGIMNEYILLLKSDIDTERVSSGQTKTENCFKEMRSCQNLQDAMSNYLLLSGFN